MSCIFGHEVKRLYEKDRVNFRLYDIKAWLTNNGNKYDIDNGNKYETMTFAQLVECNMRKNFLEKSYQTCGGESSPRLFSEKLKLSTSFNQ